MEELALKDLGHLAYGLSASFLPLLYESTPNFEITLFTYMGIFFMIWYIIIAIIAVPYHWFFPTIGGSESMIMTLLS